MVDCSCLAVTSVSEKNKTCIQVGQLGSVSNRPGSPIQRRSIVLDLDFLLLFFTKPLAFLACLSTAAAQQSLTNEQRQANQSHNSKTTRPIALHSRYSKVAALRPNDPTNVAILPSRSELASCLSMASARRTCAGTDIEITCSLTSRHCSTYTVVSVRF